MRVATHAKIVRTEVDKRYCGEREGREERKDGRARSKQGEVRGERGEERGDRRQERGERKEGQGTLWVGCAGEPPATMLQKLILVVLSRCV